MKQKQVENCKKWFDKYVCDFYGDDEFVNANIRLKDNHSKRVCEEMDYLTNQLQLSENQKRIAQVIAMLHDIGRFKQFIKYRTYNDPKSVNHCLLGLEVLRNTKILDGIDGQERQIIEKAIELHGKKELPAGLDGEMLLYAKLIRDADKIDIYYVVIDYYKKYQQNPNDFKLEIELPDTPEYSKNVVENILQEKRIDYRNLQTWNDMKLCQLSWVYDINFTDTLKRIRRRNYIEQIVEFLPDTVEIRKVKQKILTYLDRKIEKAV